MTFRLTVAPGLAPLADALADELARPLADPFAAEVVAVPGDGTRTWLAGRLASRLGATGGDAPDGIVANVSFVFPAQLISRAMGDDRLDQRWGVGQLTWAIYETVHEHGEALGITADAVRCRAIADLFDRYALHRPVMVRQWERNVNVDPSGAPLAEHLRWQPALWRLLLERVGTPSSAGARHHVLAKLRAGRPVDDLPERVFLVGVAGLPQPHLDILAALATQIDVHVLVPTPSLPLWRSVLDVVRPAVEVPVLRATDPTAGAARHELTATWGRSARESMLLMANTAVASGAQIAEIEGRAGFEPVSARPTLLARVQAAIRADEPPARVAVAGQPDRRPLYDPDDHSLQWHRCHGAARQVEVLRDTLVRLLEEHQPDGTPRFEPRDITVLCPDLGMFAPLLEATFAGDPVHGVPALPLRIADRSQRQDDPLLDTVGALIELLDGRFRASSVLAFAARLPVRRKFGLGPEQLGRLAGWVEATNVRWGLDATSRQRFGVPLEISTHTWQAGVDQLLIGAAMADDGPRVGPGGTVPHDGIEGDDVEVVGAVAELLHRLAKAADRLSRPQTVADWCAAIADAAVELCAVPDADAWQWRDLHRALLAFEQDATLDDRPCAVPVPPVDLAALLTARLAGRPGRARFGTGTITVSSLTAQRGVPQPVICLLGLDGDLSGAGPMASDDLTATQAFVGDNEPRSETRAQLLDALLAAGDRLIVCSTGHDLRTNAELPPAVPLAELSDLIDATVRPADGRPASSAIAVDHPRQAWSHANFVPDALGVPAPWSFDRGARDAAVARRTQRRAVRFLSAPLPEPPLVELDLRDLEQALRNPVCTLLAGRLGVWIGRSERPVDDLVPVTLDGIATWQLADSLLRECLAAGDVWSDDARTAWELVQRRRGAVPPLALGDAVLSTCTDRVSALLTELELQVGATARVAPVNVPLHIELDAGRTVDGLVAGVRDHTLVEVTAARSKPAHLLVAWARLAALTTSRPDQPWEAVIVGRTSRSGSDDAVAQRLRMASPDAARSALDVIVDLHDRARCDVVPFFPATSKALLDGGRSKAEGEWWSQRADTEPSGEGADRWVRFALGDVDFDELMDEATPERETGPGWGGHPCRVQQWAHRVWDTLAATAVVSDGRPHDHEGVSGG